LERYRNVTGERCIFSSLFYSGKTKAASEKMGKAYPLTGSLRWRKTAD
jgi:hypothetical protein